MSGVVDRGAVVAAYVGIGMAVTMAISLLLVIPIEPAYVLQSAPGGLIIGYYANARSARARGQWRRIVPNALAAGLATALTLAALALATKALFFFGDSGYPNFNRRDAGTGAILEPTCIAGGDCVYRRYLLEKPQIVADAGVTNAAAFGDVYWSQQWSTARLLVGLTTSSALLGAVLFGIAGPRKPESALRGAAAPA